MKNIFLGIICTSLAIVSCKKDEKPTLLKDENGNSQPAALVSNNPQASLLQQSGITTQNTTTSAPTQAGINPPHGQPGHQCEIPVGQPLNAKAGGTTGQNIAVNPNQPQAIQIDPNAMNAGKTGTKSPISQVKTAPGMNPPHGEAGHRCDIQVGQPLNSKPAAATTAPNVVAPPSTPAPKPIAANGPKPKLNPAHGEPFHDCAKQVGEAL